MNLPCKNWCRLCLADNDIKIDVFSSKSNDLNLEELIAKYFLTKIKNTDVVSTKICVRCYNFIRKISIFSEHVAKVNQILSHLLTTKDSIEFDIHKYEIHRNDFVGMCDQSTDTNDLENKPIQDESKNDKYEQLLPEDNEIKSELVDGDEDDEIIEELDDVEEGLNEILSVVIKPEINCYEEENVELPEKINIPLQDNDNVKKSSDKKTFYKRRKLRNRNAFLERKSVSKVVEEKSKDCDKECNNENKIRKRKIERFHVKRRVGKLCKCHICEKSFSTNYVLKMHIEAMHTEPKYECTICQKKFTSEKRLKVHGDSHVPYEQRNACPYCDKKFTKFLNIKYHIRTVHLNERKYVCEECGKAFGTKNILDSHKLTHFKETPFKCEKCGKSFKSKRGLKIHEETHADGVCICPQCGTQLKNRRTLNTHMLVHFGEKKYKCEHCGMAFKRPGHLKHHLISHIGLKLFSCPFCDKSFTNNRNRHLHMSKVHPHEVESEAALTKLPNEIPSLDQLKAIAAKSSL